MEYNWENVIKDFSEDDSYFSDYDYLTIKKDEEVLVRFMELPKEQHKLIITGYKLNRQGRLEEDIPDVDLSPSNIGVVIKSNSSEYKVGELVCVPNHLVNGTVETPEYMLLLQYSKGNMEPIVPNGFRKRMAKIEASFGEFMVKHPKNLKPTKEDRLTYLLPSFKIQSGYDISFNN